MQWVRDHFENDAPYDVEYRDRLPDGEYIWIRSVGRVVRSPDGRPVRMVGSNENISERKRHERFLAESESRLVEAQQLAHIGSWDRNLATGEITWSDQLFRLLGLDPEKDKPSVENFLFRVHSDDQPVVQSALHDQEVPGGQRNYDHRLVLPDGEVRFVHVRAEPIFGKNNTLVRVRGTVQDVTELRL